MIKQKDTKQVKENKHWDDVTKVAPKGEFKANSPRKKDVKLSVDKHLETQNTTGEDSKQKGMPVRMDNHEGTFNLSKKVFQDFKGKDNIYFEKDVKEFIRRLKEELTGDTLAYGYKDYEKSRENMSTIEICNDNEDCNSFVMKRIKRIMDNLAGDKLK